MIKYIIVYKYYIQIKQMSVTNSIFFGKKQSNVYKKRNHRTNLKCLKECSNYILSISCNQRNEANYSFFSKILH